MDTGRKVGRKNALVTQLQSSWFEEDKKVISHPCIFHLSFLRTFNVSDTRLGTKKHEGFAFFFLTKQAVFLSVFTLETAK